MVDTGVVGEPKAYDAFISYSHAADGRLAPALQRGLQQLGRSWRQRRAMEVFRDETGLAVNPDLWGSIVDALDASEWFLLLASPRAAESRWVGQEIEHCLATKGIDRILVVVTDGTLEWDAEAGDFTPGSDAAHPALRGLLAQAPTIVDLSWARSATDLTNDNERFRTDVARIAAIMRGQSLSQVVEGDDRERRRTRRVVRSAITALAAVTAVAVVAAVLAVVNQRDATRQRDLAEAEARIALARELAARARTEEAPRAALAMAVEAHAILPETDAAGALLTVLSGVGVDSGTVTVPDTLPEGYGPADVWSSSANGRVVLQQDGPALLVDLESDTTWSLPGSGYFLSPEGDLALGIDGSVYRLDDSGQVELIASLPPGGGEPGFAGDTVAYLQLEYGAAPVVVVADLTSGESSTVPIGTGDADCGGCLALDLSPDGETVVARVVGTRGQPSDAVGEVVSIEVGTPGDSLQVSASLPVTGPGTVRFTDDGSSVWARDGDRFLVLDPADLEPAGGVLPITRAGPLDFLDDTRALAPSDECETPAVIAAPAMASVASLPGEIDFTEGGCLPQEGYAAWVAGGAWILTGSGLWPGDGDALADLVCDALGGRLSPAEFSDLTGSDHAPEACDSGREAS